MTSSAVLVRQSGGSKKTTTSSGADARKISCEDIQLVQNLVERCLQLYMNQPEVIHTLQFQAKVEPGFTKLVWQKLEEQNPEFFKAYHTRLRVKDQIILFNHLLEQQGQLMQKLGWGWGGSRSSQMRMGPGPMGGGMMGGMQQSGMYNQMGPEGGGGGGGMVGSPGGGWGQAQGSGMSGGNGHMSQGGGMPYNGGWQGGMGGMGMQQQQQQQGWGSDAMMQGGSMGPPAGSFNAGGAGMHSPQMGGGFGDFLGIGSPGTFDPPVDMQRVNSDIGNMPRAFSLSDLSADLSNHIDANGEDTTLLLQGLDASPSTENLLALDRQMDAGSLLDVGQLGVGPQG